MAGERYWEKTIDLGRKAQAWQGEGNTALSQETGSMVNYKREEGGFQYLQRE